MNARYLGVQQGDDVWIVASTRGCCTFSYRFSSCHACLNEINVYALERRIAVRAKYADRQGSG